MERIVEFIGNHPLLTGIFGVVLLAWIVYEVSRVMRQWKEVDTLEAVRLINRDDAIVIDVSNSADYAQGHIAAALHMPPSKIEAGNQQLLKHREHPVLVYCKNGQVSPQMANRLTKLGFTNVHLLAGGLAQWISDQQPVSRHKGAGKPGRGKSGDKKEKKSRSGKKAAGQED